MTNQLKLSIVSLLSIWMACKSAATAQIPVFEVEPSQHVLHGLDFESIVVTHEIWTRLRGPSFFAFSDPASERPLDYLVGYKVENPKPPKTKSVELKNGMVANLGNSAFVILPAQKITSGPPPAIPDDLGFFVVYEAEFSGADGPTHIAVPSGLRHHDEELPVVNETRVLLLSPTSEQTTAPESATIIDHFGLNRLKLGSTIMSIESAELK